MRHYPVFRLAAVLAVTACADRASPATLASSIELFRNIPIDEAIHHFDSLVAEHPSDPALLAWRSHVLLTDRRFEEAIAGAREALAVEPCQSIAHTVIGASYNPQYHWESANEELSWHHLAEARRCAPTDGYAWSEAVVPAMRLGARNIEDNALRRLIELGFFSSATIAFNRWMLQALPQNALLITMGDLDTFPALGLQLAERLRADVGIVNVNLLSAWWYASQIADRHQVPLVTLSDSSFSRDATLERWRSMSLGGSLGREMVFSPTVPAELIPDGRGRLELAGVYRALRPTAAAVSGMTLATDSFTTLAGADFAGPTASDQDRSRLRGFDRHGFPLLVLYLALRHGQALIHAGRVAEASTLAAWATEFADDAGIEEQERTDVTALRSLPYPGSPP